MRYRYAAYCSHVSTRSAQATRGRLKPSSFVSSFVLGKKSRRYRRGNAQNFSRPLPKKCQHRVRIRRALVETFLLCWVDGSGGGGCGGKYAENTRIIRGSK